MARAQPFEVSPHVPALRRIDVERRVIPPLRREDRAEQERPPLYGDAARLGRLRDAHRRRIGIGAGELEPELYVHPATPLTCAPPGRHPFVSDAPCQWV